MPKLFKSILFDHLLLQFNAYASFAFNLFGSCKSTFPKHTHTHTHMCEPILSNLRAISWGLSDAYRCRSNIDRIAYCRCSSNMLWQQYVMTLKYWRITDISYHPRTSDWPVSLQFSPPIFSYIDSMNRIISHLFQCYRYWVFDIISTYSE